MNENDEQLSVISKETNSDSSEVFTNSFLVRLVSSESLLNDSEKSFVESVLVKSTCQDYEGILQGLEVEGGCQKERISMALTSAKGSLVDQQKARKNSQEIFHHNAFAMPGKFFCKNCEDDMVSVIKFLPSEEGFWMSLGKFMKMKCCVEKENIPDIVHECPNCHGVLARITAIC